VMSLANSQSTQERFAQLWLIPQTKHVGQIGDKAQLGVESFEGKTSRFLIVMSYTGGTDHRVQTWTVQLENNEIWRKTVNRPNSGVLQATLTQLGGGSTKTQTVMLQP
jgi:hypothetical protein